MIFSSTLLNSLHFINFCSTFCNNLQSDIIYSPTLGTSADVPYVPCRAPLPITCGLIECSVHLYGLMDATFYIKIDIDIVIVC